MRPDMAFCKDRSFADGGLLAAVATLLKAVALNALRVLLERFRADAFEAVGAILDAAMLADRTILSQHGFVVGEGRGFVVHVGFGQDG